jgi:hypothetical protein
MKPFSCATLALFLTLYGCSPTGSPPVSGGGNDFPNPPSAAALGKIIADNVSKGDHWADSITLPAASSPAAIAQSVSVPSVPVSGMAKRATTSQTLRFDLSDTAKGIVRVYYGLVSDTLIKNDTFVVLCDEAFRDNVKNNEHLYLLKGASVNRQTLLRSSYLFVDSDGDSVVNNRNGRPNSVFASISTVPPLGPTAKFEIELAAGSDGNLDTKAGLRILRCQSLSLAQKGDTLSMARYEGYGDSAIFDAARDSQFVRVRLIDTDVLGRRTTAEAVFLIFPADSAGNRPAYFRSVKSFNNGATATAIVRGPGSDSLFKANDTALAYVIIERPDNVVAVDTLGLRIITGASPSDEAGNALAGLYSHKIKHSADDRETIVSLTSGQPVEQGQSIQSGTFSVQIIYADGRWIKLAGSIAPSSVTANYVDSKGNTRSLQWDRSGEQLQ